MQSFVPWAVGLHTLLQQGLLRAGTASSTLDPLMHPDGVLQRKMKPPPNPTPPRAWGLGKSGIRRLLIKELSGPFFISLHVPREGGKRQDEVKYPTQKPPLPLAEILPAGPGFEGLKCKVERLFHKASSPRGPSGSNRAPRVLPVPGHRARACASAVLARSSLLVFTGTLARFRCSRLVFLANSSRVKLFNNIFGGMQAAGEPEPKRFSFLASADSPLQASLRQSYDLKS
ncbi:hypothetical protein Anapl_18067 [Anas platyrhynchos]|uniref:Uncharacterized protein n=1 Tax=Anas platyrhynchos TaxID=8839 RepID=R0KM81_ANAPL|nr:hypothetical protein Anapl_18067 [Anas platyrhynchos]